MVGVAGDAVEQRGANRPSRGGRYRDPRRERSGRKDRGAVPATLREVGADAVRAADEKAGGIERVEFGIKVVEADADRGGVADLLVDPRLVEPQRADAGLDIAHRLGVAGQFADRAAIVIETIDVELRAGPAGEPVEIGLEHQVAIVEIARAAP